MNCNIIAFRLNTRIINIHQFINLKTFLVFTLYRKILRNKEILRSLQIQFLPRNILYGMCFEVMIFFNTLAEEFVMINFGNGLYRSVCNDTPLLHKDADTNTLHNIKDIFVFPTIRCLFHLSRITMQIQNIYLIKSLQ